MNTKNTTIYQSISDTTMHQNDYTFKLNIYILHIYEDVLIEVAFVTDMQYLNTSPPLKNIFKKYINNDYKN